MVKGTVSLFRTGAPMIALTILMNEFFLLKFKTRPWRGEIGKNDMFRLLLNCPGYFLLCPGYFLLSPLKKSQ